MLRAALLVGLCLTSACGKSDSGAAAPVPTAPVPADAGETALAPPQPGEDLQVWFVAWFEHLAEAGETGKDCAEIARRWSHMADGARPHFAKIKEIEASQTDEQKKAWADKHIDRLKPAQTKVEASIARCKDDPAFQQTMQKVLSLL